MATEAPYSTNLPDVSVTRERFIPAREAVVLYYWESGTDVDDSENAVIDHPFVKKIQFVNSVMGEYLVRLEWAMEYDAVLTVLVETGVVLITATGTDTPWILEILKNISFCFIASVRSNYVRRVVHRCPSVSS